jgi:hypothetical protein
MPKIDYSSLINGDEEEVIVQETPAAFNMARTTENWNDIPGHDRYYNLSNNNLIGDEDVSTVDKTKQIVLDQN